MTRAWPNSNYASNHRDLVRCLLLLVGWQPQQRFSPQRLSSAVNLHIKLRQHLSRDPNAYQGNGKVSKDYFYVNKSRKVYLVKTSN